MAPVRMAAMRPTTPMSSTCRRRTAPNVPAAGCARLTGAVDVYTHESPGIQPMGRTDLHSDDSFGGAWPHQPVRFACAPRLLTDGRP